MRSNDIPAAENALVEIKNVLNEYAFGLGNEEAKSKIRASISTIRLSVRCEGYLGEKLGAMEAWLDILYSARKHERYPQGARGIKTEMLSLCSRLKDALPDD